MALKNHLFPNVIAPRDHASELHPLSASWALGAMIILALGHALTMHDSLANL
jgi:hypothetical protein